PRRTCRRRHRAARTAGRRALHPRGDADTARGPRQGSGMSVPRPAGSLSFVILGLSITSSWGNGHATTYRGLVRALAGRGHDVVFLERDAPWYADNRDLPRPPYGVTNLYAGVEELIDRFSAAISSADVVVVGSYVPDGIKIGEWVTQAAGGITIFYDIDT